MQHKYGFTLIELVIVIVLLGILSAVALPKFMDLSGDAHLSSVRGSAAALSSGINLAHSKYLIAVNTTDFDGDGTADLIFNSTTKWPDGFYVGGVATDLTASAAACIGLWETVLDTNSATVAASTATSPDYMAVNSATGCSYDYRGNVASGDAATITVLYAVATGVVSVSGP
jgi:prepilin-type N-terminal cleavage/methylation domain-containing protein